MPLGMFFATLGIMIGKTGPAVAIINSCGVCLLVMNANFKGVVPTYVKIIGSCLVFVGVSICVLGNSIIKLKK